MHRKLKNYCEVFSRGKLFDINLYDDNGNTCFSKGTLHLSTEDVSSIKTLMDISDNRPYSFHLNGTNYLCVKTAAHIVYGRGNFNQQATGTTCSVSKPEMETHVDVTLDVDISTDDAVNKNTNNVSALTDAGEQEEQDEDSSSSREICEERRVQTENGTSLTSAVIPTEKCLLKVLNNGTTSFAAMNVKGYLVMFHGVHDGCQSWLSIMEHLNKQITKFIS